MGMVKLQPLTESKPLNRLRPIFAQLITSTRRTLNPKLCQSAHLLKWPVSGFLRKMAQNTQQDARMCLLGVWTMADNI